MFNEGQAEFGYLLHFINVAMEKLFLPQFLLQLFKMIIMMIMMIIMIKLLMCVMMRLMFTIMMSETGELSIDTAS